MNLGGIGAGLTQAGNSMREKQQWDAQQAQIATENEFKRQQLAIQQALADRQAKEYDRKVAGENFDNSAKLNPTGWVDDPNAVGLAEKAGITIPKMNLTPPRINQIENAGGQDLTSIAGKYNIPPAQSDNPLKALQQGEPIIPSGPSIDSKAVPSGVSPSTGVRIPEGIQQQRSMSELMQSYRDGVKNGNIQPDPNIMKGVGYEAMTGKPAPAGVFNTGGNPYAGGFADYTDTLGKYGPKGGIVHRPAAESMSDPSLQKYVAPQVVIAPDASGNLQRVPKLGGPATPVKTESGTPATAALPGAMQSTAAGAEGVEELLKRINENPAKDEWTGIRNGPKTMIKLATGWGVEPGMRESVANLNFARAAILRTLTGVSANPTEYKNVENSLPTLNMPASQWPEAMRASWALIDSIRAKNSRTPMKPMPSHLPTNGVTVREGTL